ncbi:hypothetical protein AVEN_158623-1 [Araneus ventricosus]|uniref:Uncharacterized protein n=1 Tax=Araneus ventricosus TaxID=182803 RepID=A0A4Y2I6M1_ARAVE|nr:hypothetical protein AVEN_158623-1 [Araneus ventricosus]
MFWAHPASQNTDNKMKRSEMLALESDIHELTFYLHGAPKTDARGIYASLASPPRRYPTDVKSKIRFSSLYDEAKHHAHVSLSWGSSKDSTIFGLNRSSWIMEWIPFVV